MNIDKDTILKMLRGNGQHTEADQAQQQLPDQVDTDEPCSHRDRSPEKGVINHSLSFHACLVLDLGRHVERALSKRV